MQRRSGSDIWLSLHPQIRIEKCAISIADSVQFQSAADTCRRRRLNDVAFNDLQVQLVLALWFCKRAITPQRASNQREVSASRHDTDPAGRPHYCVANRCIRFFGPSRCKFRVALQQR